MSYRPNADARPDAPYVANANAPTRFQEIWVRDSLLEPIRKILSR
jgi:hypothetical protein